MKNKKRIMLLENKVEQLEKDLRLQKWMIENLLDLKGMRVTGTNSIKPLEPVRVESYGTCLCEVED